MMTIPLHPDLALLVGRVLLAALFLQSGLTKPFAWAEAMDELASFGMPRSRVLLAGSLATQLAGGLSIAFGLMTPLGALLLIAFMAPATFWVHGFWRYKGAARAHHVLGFYQNLTMSGGLVVLLAAGPGRWSVDGILGAAAP